MSPRYFDTDRWETVGKAVWWLEGGAAARCERTEARMAMGKQN